MYVNEAEKTLLAKICYFGAPNTGKADLLRALYDYIAARDGANTHLETRQFAAREELEQTMSADAATKFMATAEQAFGAAYDELVHDTLVWLRAPVVSDPGPRTYARIVDVFSGNSAALRRYSLQKADALVFVADLADADATLNAWADLRATDYRGPIVLLSNRAVSPDELVELLGYEGPAFAEPQGFSGNHDAFETASTLALRRVNTAN